MKKNSFLLIAAISGFLNISTVYSQAQDNAPKKPCMTCEELIKIRLPDIVITQVASVKENLSYCRVLGTIGTEINFELLLPEEWNQRFVMGGGGGFVGSIQNHARSKIKDGYATVGTDTGHKSSGQKADWGLYNLERQVNFGHLAVHRTAEAAKAIINEFYGTYPLYNYFLGCSRGGGQALIEAQRYPDDFNGIVAAAPIIDWPSTGAEFIQNTQVLYPDPHKLDAAALSPGHIRILNGEVLKQCDEIDGVKDQILNDPRDCRFNFSKLPVCPGNVSGPGCFTTEQLKVLKTIYEGISNNEGKIYPGWPFGGENEPGGWMQWIVGPVQGSANTGFPSLHFAFGTEMFKNLIFQDPDWDYSTFTFDDLKKKTRAAAANLNATSVDYSGLKKHGGKMIINHGWNDPALSVFTSINHYEAAKKTDNELEKYIRLFLLPGVLHCGGGQGPSQVDWVELIRQWVETCQAPEKIVLTKTEEGKAIMTRPVFPYPAKAVYNGSGDPNLESSFIKKQ